MVDPKVTVLMPVYNVCKFVQESIQSVLQQSFTGFEFIVIDDGSSDDTVAKVQSFQDERIRLVKNDNNIGVARTLNRGLDLARGEYVARMDADDICHRRRLEKQFNFMERNKDIGASGTWVKFFGDQLPVVERTPFGADVVNAFLLFDNALYHPSVIIRKGLLDQFNLRYDPAYSRSEDYELWLRATDHFPLDNLPEPLLQFRCHSGSVTRTAAETMKLQACDLLRRGLQKLDMYVTIEDLLFHYSVSKGHRLYSLHMLRKAEQWLARLIRQNAQISAYRQDSFLEAVGMIWFRLCYHSSQLGFSSWTMNKHSRIATGYHPSLEEKGLFMLSILVNKIIHR